MLRTTDNTSSIWERTAVPAPAVSPLSADVRCETAIVGAGFTGLSAALHLASLGRSAIVLEQGEIGSGASGSNGGQVVPGLKHDPETLLQVADSKRGNMLLEFVGGCADRTFDLIKINQMDCDAAQTGWLQPAVTPKQFEVIRKRAEQWRQYGKVDVQILDRSAVSRAIGTNVYIGGWVDPRGGRLQPLSYVRELARAAIEKGARIHNRTKAVSLKKQDSVWILKTSNNLVVADRVILATNAYRQDLIAPLNRSIIFSHSVQIATQPLSKDERCGILPAGLPVSDGRRLLKYFRFDPQGRFLIGGRGSFGETDSGRHFASLRNHAVKMFPQLANVRWERSWAGKIALTTDHLPHVHNPASGLYASVGYNGRGVALSSQIGTLLAKLSDGMPHELCPLPVTDIRKIPFRWLHRPMLEAIVAWYRILDKL